MCSSGIWKIDPSGSSFIQKRNCLDEENENIFKDIMYGLCDGVAPLGGMP